MPMETELKYLGVNLDDVRHRLQALGADFQGKRFESNIVFDDEQRSLKGRGILVRLRDDGRRILTLKRPPAGPVPEGVKAWDEHETRIDDPGVIETLLGTLGYAPAFSYEKVREEWILEGCHICLDQMPFGDFLEIEGDPLAIPVAASALGVKSCEASTKNYHQLNREHREAVGLEPRESFVFDSDKKKALLAQLSKASESGQIPHRS
ncbi:class IV adenylate cyclase [Desulfovibrio ferrophilus]|uniref:Adenylate cyclase n=1 Tax=Desulfovibrio ferrophilus TaxID=241368 RepID=A0A2Z6AWD9_9BACT|nr:class IV adenylate cyclase [Desulfovibrio ferrophilus]BBD07503.1 adenylate cyclase [Desulfovibrio ferrophilus]